MSVIIKHCQKRDGRTERFNKNKIQNAILEAFKASKEGNQVIAKKVTRLVLEQINQKYNKQIPNIEEIQDAVEESLMDLKFKKTAKEYIIYRKLRSMEREKKNA